MTQHTNIDALQAALNDHQGPTFVISVEQLQGIIARLRKAEAASQWQPIATAPKDGTVIHGYDPNWYDIATPMKWNSKQQRWELFFINQEILPTHWMPLPSIPVSAPSDSGREGA